MDQFEDGRLICRPQRDLTRIRQSPRNHNARESHTFFRLFASMFQWEIRTRPIRALNSLFLRPVLESRDSNTILWWFCVRFLGEDTLLGDQTYRYLTADEMKSLGDDSLPIDVTRDERIDSNRMVISGDSNMLPPQNIEDNISPEHVTQNYVEYIKKYQPDNVDIGRHPINIGYVCVLRFSGKFLFKLKCAIIDQFSILRRVILILISNNNT